MLSKDTLQKEYIENKLSTWAIEKKHSISRSSVYTLLKKYDIPIRTLAQSHVKYDRKGYDGDSVDMAYLVGFAIGDLRVRNHGKNIKSETISIACGSTKRAQIDLIVSLFANYGRVWVGKPGKRGVINVEAYVDKSFNFLLPTSRTYAQYHGCKDEFFSFLAGVTDAEGSFYLSNGQAFVSWGNYDYALLEFIKEGLEKQDIKVPKICSDTLKGYIGSDGYSRNQCYHHISICRKNELKKLLAELEPRIRHEDKLEKLTEVRQNLAHRDH